MFRGVVVFVGLGLLAVATTTCGGDSSNPTAPSVTRTTETFSGTVQVGGNDFHSFKVTQTGNTDVTLTAAGPPSTIVMGVALGTADDSGCTRIVGGSVNVPAGSTPQLIGLTSPATLCVEIRDVGNQTAPVTYTVSVTHP